MRKTVIPGLLMLLISLLLTGAACGEASPLAAEEIASFAEQVRALADGAKILNDPTLEEAVSEDGIALQYDFGILYADRPSWSAETGLMAAQIMDAEVAGPRGLAINRTVNEVMDAVPCGNEGMYGTREAAALYLTGNPETGFLYGRAERDGQRLSAMEYGAVDMAAGTKISLILGISGDGVSFMRLEGLGETFSPEALADFYQEMEALTGEYAYSRVPRSLTGTDLARFQEGDLYFASLSYPTAEPAVFGHNVEDMLSDNDDGTWLRRIDGDGFEMVFSCDAAGENVTPLSYAIRSPDLEGPRGVRLGDLFHEDFTRFRSGEGQLSEDGLTEVLYGTPGTAPYGLAEYGNGSEMTLRYVTETLGGPDVELILRYEDTVLSEIILHTLEEDE